MWHVLRLISVRAGQGFWTTRTRLSSSCPDPGSVQHTRSDTSDACVKQLGQKCLSGGFCEIATTFETPGPTTLTFTVAVVRRARWISGRCCHVRRAKGISLEETLINCTGTLAQKHGLRWPSWRRALTAGQRKARKDVHCKLFKSLPFFVCPSNQNLVCTEKWCQECNHANATCSPRVTKWNLLP